MMEYFTRRTISCRLICHLALNLAVTYVTPMLTSANCFFNFALKQCFTGLVWKFSKNVCFCSLKWGYPGVLNWSSNITTSFSTRRDWHSLYDVITRLMQYFHFLIFGTHWYGTLYLCWTRYLRPGSIPSSLSCLTYSVMPELTSLIWWIGMLIVWVHEGAKKWWLRADPIYSCCNTIRNSI